MGMRHDVARQFVAVDNFPINKFEQLFILTIEIAAGGAKPGGEGVVTTVFREGETLSHRLGRA